MRRRLDLAMALVHRPRVLFLDEPTTGLDPASRAALWREVRPLNDDGTTVFLTTQYLEEAEQLADRVGIIDRGKIVAEGTPDELKAHVGEPALHVELVDPSRAERGARGARRARRCSDRRGGGLVLRTSAGARAIAPVIRALDESGIEVETVEVETPTLDDVFLAVTGHTRDRGRGGRGRGAAGVRDRARSAPATPRRRAASSPRSPRARSASSSGARSS